MKIPRRFCFALATLIVSILAFDQIFFGYIPFWRVKLMYGNEAPDKWLFLDCLESLNGTWGDAESVKARPHHATDRLRTIVVADHWEYVLDLMTLAASRLGIELRIVGLDAFGKKIGHGRGFGRKLNYVRDAFNSPDIDDDEIVMFVDAYDVMLLGPATELISRFLKADCEIVFAPERALWPRYSLAERFPLNSSPYRFLNSGSYIGYARSIRKYLDNCGSPFDPLADDQAFFTFVFLNPPTPPLRLCLDYKNDIFQCMYNSKDDISYIGGQVYNNLTGGNPLVVHFNGAGKAYLAQWYKTIYDLDILSYIQRQTRFRNMWLAFGVMAGVLFSFSAYSFWRWMLRLRTSSNRTLFL
mmetsp:Transcript_18150/g.30275  ORF Transcript_18150/g.30275 Transcript_18150/m.30275 type:complete len:356 (-) Transcript_18150:607-1674(-)